MFPTKNGTVLALLITIFGSMNKPASHFDPPVPGENALHSWNDTFELCGLTSPVQLDPNRLTVWHKAW